MKSKTKKKSPLFFACLSTTDEKYQNSFNPPKRWRLLFIQILRAKKKKKKKEKNQEKINTSFLWLVIYQSYSMIDSLSQFGEVGALWHINLRGLFSAKSQSFEKNVRYDQ